MVDGDAPPERFDHTTTVPSEQVLNATYPDFLRKNGLDPDRNQGQIAALVRHRSVRLPGPFATQPFKDATKTARL